MAGRTITQRIALVGGEAIKATFETLGAAGRRAYSQIADVNNAESAVTKLGTSINSLRGKVDQLKSSAGNVGSSFQNLATSVGSIGERLGLLAGGGAIAAARGLVEIARSAGDSQEALDNTAAAIGVAAEELDEWQKIAELNGVEAGAFTKAMLKLNGAMRETASASSKAAEEKRRLNAEFRAGRITDQQYIKGLQDIKRAAAENETALAKLGIRVKNADGTFRNTFQVFKEFGAGLQGVNDAVVASGMSLSTLGKKSAPLITVARITREEFEKQRAEIRRLAPTLNEAERNGLDRFADRMTLLGRATEATRLKLAAIFAPSLTSLTNGAIEGVVKLRDKYLDLATTIEQRFRPIADDIGAALSGGEVKDEGIRDLVEKVKQAAIDISGAITFIAKAIAGIKWVLDGVAAVINAVFGTQLTGGTLLAIAALAKLTGVLGVVMNAGKFVVTVFNLLGTAFGFLRVSLVGLAFSFGFIATTWVIKVGGIKAATAIIIGALPGIFKAALSGVLAVLRVIGMVIVETAKAVWGLIVAGAQEVPGLIAAAFNGLGALIYAAFEALAGLLAGVWDGVKGAVAGAWSAIVETVAGFAAQIGARAAGAWQTITQGAAAAASVIGSVWAVIAPGAYLAWTAIAAAAGAAWQAIANGAGFVAAALGAVWGAIAEVAGGAWSAIVGAAGAAWQAVVDLWGTLTGALQSVWDGITAAVNGAWAAISGAAVSLWGSIVEVFESGWAAVVATTQSALGPILAALRSIYDMAARAAGAMSGALGGGGGDVAAGAPGLAGGGPARGAVRGPGTGTSDSILAWLSNGEFVIRAAAVRKFGVGFFAALNALRTPVAAFARGGLAAAASAILPAPPRFDIGLVAAPAGPAAGGAPFTLQIGAETFGGMTASQDAIDKLQRYAAAKAVRSAGRKPSWYQG